MTRRGYSHFVRDCVAIANEAYPPTNLWDSHPLDALKSKAMTRRGFEPLLPP